MGVTYVKNGKTYVYGPIHTLNDDIKHTGKKRGEKIQKLFDENGIDIDLSSGTGSDISGVFCIIRGDNNEITEGERVFEGTDYEKNSGVVEKARNVIANTRLLDCLKNSVFTSRLLVYKKGEEYPRIIYFDKDEPKLSQPVNLLNPAKMKPKEPGWFHSLLHKINDEWYKDEFTEYEKQKGLYDIFERDFPEIKAKVEEENKIRKDEINNKKDIFKKYADFEELKNVADKRIDNFLGVNPRGDKDLKDKGVYKDENYQPEEHKYPENCPFTEHEIAMIGYAMLSRPDIARMRHNTSTLSDEDIVHENITHLVHDVFFAERQKSFSTVSVFEPCRKKACELLKKYSEGEKEPLARALGDSVRELSNLSSKLGKFSVLNMSTIHTNREIWNIINSDPELLSKCGLSEEEIVKAKGLYAVCDMYDNYVRSSSKLQQAAGGDGRITEEEKKELLSDVISFRLINYTNNRDVSQNNKATEEEKKKCQDALLESIDKNVKAREAKEKAEKALADAKKEKKDNIAELEAKLKECEIKAKEAAEKNEEASTKMFAFDFKCETAKTVLTLGESENGHKNLSEEIKNTEAFKNLCNKPIDEIAALQRQYAKDGEEKNDELCNQILNQMVRGRNSDDASKKENKNGGKTVKNNDVFTEEKENIIGKGV